MNWIEWLLWSSVMLLIAYVCGVMVEKYIIKREPEETERLNYPDPPKNPYNAATNDILKAMAKSIEDRAIISIAQHPFAPMALMTGVPADRTVRVPKDVWAELQAMPNDGSWSTRQLVRAIQRANKKKRGAP